MKATHRRDLYKLRANDVDWSAYESRYKALKPRMEKFIRFVANEVSSKVDVEVDVYEEDSDEYGFSLLILSSIHNADNDIRLSLVLRDSGDADTGIYGVKGNLLLDAAYGDGTMLISYAPYNYSDRCWLGYKASSWGSRMAEVAKCTDTVILQILEAIYRC